MTKHYTELRLIPVELEVWQQVKSSYFYSSIIVSFNDR